MLRNQKIQFFSEDIFKKQNKADSNLGRSRVAEIDSSCLWNTLRFENLVSLRYDKWSEDARACKGLKYAHPSLKYFSRN